jgi:KDO2-lipid IV(A) lauroyltransferase
MSRKPRHPLRNALETAAAGAFAALLRLLPRRAALGFGAGAALLVHDLLRIRVRHARGELRRAFPEAEDAWVRRTVRGVYRHFGMLAAELARIPLHVKRGWGGTVRCADDSERLMDEAVASGRGAAIVSAHYGNWETVTAFAASRGYPLHAVVAQQSNSAIEELLDRQRRAAGIRIIKRDEAPRPILKALRSGELLAFMMDQDARRAGIFVPFFGRPASTFRGPAVLALKAGSDTLFMESWREPDTTIRYRLRKVEIERTGELDEDARRLTAAWTALIEEHVRRHPDQWLWLHRRWKTVPRAGGDEETDEGSQP